MYKIRKAQKQDAVQILQLIQELAIFEKQPHAVELTLESLERDGFGENPKYLCWIAEDASLKIVGIALCYYRYSTWKGSVLHLEDLIVKKEMRNQGIGSILLNEVISFAKQQKLKRVCWEVLDWNQGAIDFYIAKGAKIKKEWRLVHMDEAAIKKYSS